MRKDEVVAGESHRFLSEEGKASRIGHHGRCHEVLITCYTPRPFREVERARVTSSAFERFRQLDPTVEESFILPPDAKEAAICIILHRVRDFQPGSGYQLRPFAPPRMIVRNSWKVGICAQGNSTARPLFEELPRRDEDDVRVCIEEGRNLRICCQKLSGYEWLVVAKMPLRITLEKANLASIDSKRLRTLAFELIPPWREFISVTNENNARKFSPD